MITVIGLGYGQDSITLGALKVLQQAGRIYLRSARLPVAAGLDSLGISYETFDALFDESEDFDALNERIARTLIQQDPCVYAVSGNGTDDRGVEKLLSLAKEKGISVRILPGVSQASQTSALCGYVGGCLTVDATDFTAPDIRHCTVITDLDNPLLASDIKCILLDAYPAEHTIYFLASDAVAGKEIALFELDRQSGYGNHCNILIPPLTLEQAERYDFEHLKEIMAILRSDHGCPWDREQDHKSIRQNMIEEAYEAVQAIDLEDTEKLYDELGDVLLQVVFHAQMGKDMGEFDISDVTTAVCAKLIRRHPHIFGDVQADNSEEVLKNWDNIKKGEKHFSKQSEVLKDIPKELPALLRTTKVLKKMAKTSFPLPTAEESAAQLNALADTPAGHMGELLLHAVNLANALGESAEVELNHTLNDLIDRFTQWEENNARQ